ncbi:M48 family metallopeptidase [Sulfurospirillum arcachonense]|uniref:M48 family metallopeptidase n=1 Tax=Sulfurospirillum arcachonense TaxID=57666 RepID=UPI0004695357|nr:SprT family zinc-dependent metalloprotease [Sulfurospirillum arcachonense]
MDSFVIYNNTKLPYCVITNKRLKNLYITIDPFLGVVVKNPNYSAKKVHSIVEQKAKWIYEKLQFLSQKNSIQKIYEEENKVLLFGEKKALHVKGSLANFYKEKTKEFIPPLVEKYSLIMNVEPTNIKFRKSKRRWGSCSHINELSFNTSLVQLPPQCIEYIIVHELSHIQHKHHQKDFWLHVKEFMPNFKEHEKTLKRYSPQI